MTKKRYIKLARALMTRMHVVGRENGAGFPKGSMGHIYANIRDMDGTKLEKFKSYQEAWDSIKPARDIYGL